MDKLNDLFTKIITKLNKKVDSEEGKGLSSNDFTNEEKTKLEGIANGAQVNTIESISVNGTKVDPDGAKNVNIKAYNEDNKPEVGGRNLLLGTRDFSGDNWGNTDGWQSDGTYNGLSVMTRNTPWTGIYQEVYAKAGEIYTFSAYVKCSFSTDAPDVGIYLISSGGSGGENILPFHFHNITVDKEFKRYSYTFKVIKDISICPRIEMGTPKSDSDAISVCGLKLERGEIATDWSPAPEDLETTADNFEGVLPVEKGGTGSSIGPKFILDQSPELAEGRVIPIYMDYAGDPRNRFAAATKKYIVCNYVYNGKVYYGAVWITDFKKILGIIPATSTTAGLVKPGTGLSITEDGTLSISQEELQSMIDDAVTKAISSRTLQE